MEQNEFHAFINKVKELNDIEKVIVEENVTLGEDSKAICPFHDEKTASFSVKKDEQYAHCFGCGWGGDIISFIQKKRGLSFKDALYYLANRAKVIIPDLSQEEHQAMEKERSIEEILTKTTEYYQSKHTKFTNDYLHKRGITKESIEKFKIGYASGNLKEHLLNICHLSVDLCVEAGVLKRKDGGEIKDFFYNRVIFPVLKNEKTLFLVGRAISEENDIPKYLNLPLPIKSFYNEKSLKSKEICLVEGIIDCISLEQYGIPTVAIIGNNVQDETRLSKLERCDKIYLCLDSDSGGRVGIEAIGRVFADKIQVVELPEGQDPNDFCLSSTKDDLQKLINESQGIIHYLIRKIPSKVNKIDIPKKLEAIFEMLSYMQKIKIEAHLQNIKTYFNLNTHELDGYREHIRALQKKRYKDNKKKEANAKEKSEEFRIVTAIFPGLVDLVEHNGRASFLIKKQDELFIVNEHKHEGKTFIPPPIEKIPWLLPNGVKCLEAYKLHKNNPKEEILSKLFDDLIAYHKSVSTLPSEEHYTLLAAWDIHTYLLEQTQYTPIICLFAVPERGKSRTGKGLIYIAYRGIYVESLREAYLLRVGEHFGGALFFDVKDIWKKAEKHGSEDIILLRFEKGANVPRVLYPDKGAFEDTVYFKVFGPTIIATNEPPDQILETRAITIVMPEADAKFENEITPEAVLSLKERLLAFKATYMDEKMPDISKPADSRLGDILKPILQIIQLVKPASIPAFQRLVQELSRDKSNEKNSSLEAEVLSKIQLLENDVKYGKLAIKLITDRLNKDNLYHDNLTYQFIGRRLGAMGFKKVSIGNGCSAILWDEKLIKKLMNKYGVEKPQKHHKDHKHIKINKTPETS